MKAVEEYGEFDSYLYVDSGIDFGNNKNVLTESYDLLRSGPNGMITIQASNDTGFKEWFGIQGTIKDENFEIPVGRACNLHTQLFSNEIFKAYDNKIIPDIFIAYCTESVFSFVSAGVSQKWIILKDIVLEHLKSVDGATSGFHHIGPRGDSTNNLFGGLDIREIVKNPKLGSLDSDTKRCRVCFLMTQVSMTLTVLQSSLNGSKSLLEKTCSSRRTYLITINSSTDL